MNKTSRRVLPASLALLAALAALFAWGQRPIVVAESVVIDAPAKDVWDYVGDSLNAGQWSIFFDHISPLPEGPPDGRLGALRRCYRRADEKGITWDEKIVALDPQKLRKLDVYDLRGFRGVPRAAETRFQTTQTYEALGPAQTRLTFSAWLVAPDDAVQRFVYWLSHREGARVFRLNLANIKAAVEKRPRPHPYEAENPFD